MVTSSQLLYNNILQRHPQGVVGGGGGGGRRPEGLTLPDSPPLKSPVMANCTERAIISSLSNSKFHVSGMVGFCLADRNCF